MSTTREQLEFIYAMAKHSDLPFYKLRRIMRYAATYQRLMTEQCNRELTAREVAKVSTTRAAIAGALADSGVTAKFSGDPRGATVKLVVPDGFTNDWGQEGIVVPA